MSYTEHSIFSVKVQRMIVALVAFILFWQLFSVLFPLGVATPLDTVYFVYELSSKETSVLIYNLSISLIRILLGFLGALVFGTAAGVLMGFSTRNDDYIYIIILITMMVPSLSWAMITLVVFGLNETAIILAIILTTTPFIAVTIREGVKDTSTDLLEMADMYNFSSVRTIRHVVIPQITPYIFSGARYGLGLAWKITVVVELLGASSGVGYKLNEAFNLFSLPGVFGWTLILITVMIVIEYGIISNIEKYILDWRTKGEYQWR